MNPMIDHNDHTSMRGFIKVTNTQTGEDWYQAKNVIVEGTRYLFSRIFATLGRPVTKESEHAKWGVWGLAIGKGEESWVPTQEYPALPTQTEMYRPLLRKEIYKTQYVTKKDNKDGSFDIIPTGGINMGLVEFQTPLNATTDSALVVNGEVQAIREMGLMGGGGNDTEDPYHTKAWTKENNKPDSMTLINYKTLLPLLLPRDVTFLISWTLTF